MKKVNFIATNDTSVITKQTNTVLNEIAVMLRCVPDHNRDMKYLLGTTADPVSTDTLQLIDSKLVNLFSREAKLGFLSFTNCLQCADENDLKYITTISERDLTPMAERDLKWYRLMMFLRTAGDFVTGRNWFDLKGDDPRNEVIISAYRDLSLKDYDIEKHSLQEDGAVAINVMIATTLTSHICGLMYDDKSLDHSTAKVVEGRPAEILELCQTICGIASFNHGAAGVVTSKVANRIKEIVALELEEVTRG